MKLTSCLVWPQNISGSRECVLAIPSWKEERKPGTATHCTYRTVEEQRAVSYSVTPLYEWKTCRAFKIRNYYWNVREEVWRRSSSAKCNAYGWECYRWRLKWWPASICESRRVHGKRAVIFVMRLNEERPSKTIKRRKITYKTSKCVEAEQERELRMRWTSREIVFNSYRRGQERSRNEAVKDVTNGKKQRSDIEERSRSSRWQVSFTHSSVESIVMYRTQGHSGFCCGLRREEVK